MQAVGHVAQKVACALLAIVFDVQAQRAAARCHGLLHIAGGDHRTDLVTPQVDEPDGPQHFNAPHAPADGGLPQDGLEHGAGGRGGDDVIRDALNLHLGACEAGERACDFKAKPGGHEAPYKANPLGL